MQLTLAKSLFENVTAVAELNLGVAELAQFVYGGNLYLFINDGDATLNGGETLIELTGVTTLLTGANVEGIA
ncbi:MAG: hypothetical protein MZV65_46620 [Chromatiales bacterium]|nr:hypothetical protein [Chromatiales bacterium]